MNQLLRPVELKLAHAEQIGRAIADSVAQWTSGNSLNVRHEWLDQRLGYRLILEEFSEAPALDEWGLAVGDYVHNLRSALDNLAFALARLECDPPARPKAVAFPIFDDRDKFKSEGRRRIEQLPSNAAALVEKLQPFQRDGSAGRGTPEQDLLLWLQWLSNADKHKVPAVVLVAPEQFSHSFRVEFACDEDAALNSPPDQTLWAGPLEPGVVLMEYRTTRPVVRLEGQMRAEAIVALETHQVRQPVDAFLRDLGRYVWTACGQFERFFA